MGRDFPFSTNQRTRRMVYYHVSKETKYRTSPLHVCDHPLLIVYFSPICTQYLEVQTYVYSYRLYEYTFPDDDLQLKVNGGRRVSRLDFG